MVRDTETPGTRTIWEDNYKGFNYRLFFEDSADDNAPERVVLVKRTENVPRETILWQFDFCSVDKMEAAFSALNTMLSALAENVETKCSIKTFAFVEAFPDFTSTPLKNGVLTAKVTKNGTEVTNCKFHVINGKVYANTIALEWVNDLSTFLTVSDNLQVITCIGTDNKLDAISDYSIVLSYESDNYIEDYVHNHAGVELNGYVKISTGVMGSNGSNTWDFNNGYKISTSPNVFDNLTFGNLNSHGKVVNFNFSGTIKTTSAITNFVSIARFLDSNVAVISINGLVTMPDGKIYPLQPTFVSQDVQFYSPNGIDLKGGKIQAYVTFIDYNYPEV